MKKRIFYQGVAVLFFVFLGMLSPLMATHITGGTMGYKCLGNDQYEITLKIYRDCLNGVPWFDNPVTIGVFDAQSNALLNSYSILYDSLSNDTISLAYPDSCVCTHAAIYKDTLTLAYSSTGYKIAYQRCCRGAVVSNLVSPQTVGMTLMTEITSAAQQACNSTPIFTQDPPALVTANVPFSFNLSATDADGDSLVYSFYTPFDGADIANPLPVPPNPPPYDTVTYLAPYTSQMPLGGNVTYDATTGVFSGTVTSIGSYVVGFLVSEYDSMGTLLSKTYKDFSIIVNHSPCVPLLSTQQLMREDAIELFPNPATNQITIECEAAETVRLRWYSMMGQQLGTQTFQQYTTLDISALPNGVYFLEFETAGERLVKRIVKN